jgi:outer membrane protein TolC
MRRWLPAVLLVIAPAAMGSVQGPSAEESPLNLTLPDALSRALATNPRLAIARAGVKAASAQQRAAVAAGQPMMDFNLLTQKQGEVITITLPQGVDAAGNVILAPKILTSTYTVQPSVSASYPLYTGGRVAAGIRAARRGSRAARLRVESEAQRLVFDVTGAYLNALENRRQADLAASQRRLNEQLLEVARVRQRAGVGVILETSNLEADLAAAVQREIDARARVLQAAASLNALIGRAASAPLILTDLPQTAPPPQALPTPAGEPLTPARLAELGLDRPDLRALRQDVKQADAQIAQARAARLPQINMIGSYLRRWPETLMGSFAYTLGTSIVQSLIDGGRARAQIRAAQAERSRRVATLRSSERQMEEQVEQARVGLEAAEQRLAAEDARVRAATLGLEMARRRLAAGTAAPVEVTEAETILARAQTDAVTARFEVARARVQLAFVVGLAYPEAVASLAAASPTP